MVTAPGPTCRLPLGFTNPGFLHAQTNQFEYHPHFHCVTLLMTQGYRGRSLTSNCSLQATRAWASWQPTATPQVPIPQAFASVSC